MEGCQSFLCPWLTLCFPAGHGHGHDDRVLPLHLHHTGNVPSGPVRRGGTSLGQPAGDSAIAGAGPSLRKAVDGAPGVNRPLLKSHRPGLWSQNGEQALC